MPEWQLAAIITHLELGGAQLATLTQIEKSRFFDGPRTLLAGRGGRLDERAHRIENVSYLPVKDLRREISPRHDSRALAQLIACLRSLRDASDARLLVHTHSPKAGVLGRIAARWVGADAVVHSVHGFGHGSEKGRGRFGPVLQWVERLSGRLADGYTTDSESNRRQGHRERLFSRRPVEVVHCGYDPDVFRYDPVARTSIRRELSVGDDSPLIVTLANFKEQKDPLTFVRIAARVLERHSEAVFAYAGDGPLRPQVEQELARFRITDRVRLLGWRDDPARLLSAAEVFVLTSRWEGLPQSFGQAMAVGLPIVATAVDGAPEAVVHGETGFLHAPGDVDGLAWSIGKLLTNPELREQMVQAARARASRFDNVTMIETLDRFYATVTGV